MIHVLLDSNVPLNVYLYGVVGQKRQEPEASAQVLANAVRARIHAYLTPTAYSNTYYFLRKCLTQAAANALAKDLLDAVDIIGQDEDVFRKALSSGWSDVEDAGQYFASKADPRITHLCTNNYKHFKAATGITVVSPAELLKLL